MYRVHWENKCCPPMIKPYRFNLSPPIILPEANFKPSQKLDICTAGRLAKKNLVSPHLSPQQGGPQSIDSLFWALLFVARGRRHKIAS